MTAHEARLVRLARHHLPPEVAERWIAPLRPAVRLRACRRGKRSVGQLGGLPSLPDDIVWPVWEGEGSLNFVASIDCGRLPSDGFNIALPDSGTLLFFYFDDEAGYLDTEYSPRAVSVWHPESLVGARVIFIPAGVPAAERAIPADIQPCDFVPLTAKPILTGPDWSHPAFRAACQDLSDADHAFLNDHANGDVFTGALRNLAPVPRHRVGGHAVPVQDAVEVEVAQAQLGVRPPFNDRTCKCITGGRAALDAPRSDRHRQRGRHDVGRRRHSVLADTVGRSGAP